LQTKTYNNPNLRRLMATKWTKSGKRRACF